MDICLYISMAVALAYLCLSAAVVRGVPVSLSSTFYSLGRFGWVFQLSLAAIAFTLVPVWISHSSEGYECLPFLSCASLLFVASAPSFRMELEGKVHYSAAAVCCTCGILWQFLEGLWDATLWFACLGLTLSLGNLSKWCWWLEVCVIGSVLYNLYRLVV